VELDLVAILLQELAAHNAFYDVVAVQEGFDVELPRVNAALELEDLRLTDRDVILARRHSGPGIANVQAGNFETNVVLPNDFEVLMSWVSIDATIGEQTIRFISTHLEADVPDVRTAQAAEVLAGPADTALPVLLVGDFNQDANEDPPGPAVYALLAAGFEDVWHQKGAGPGNSCCFDELLVSPGDEPLERLDLILYRGPFNMIGTQVHGDLPEDWWLEGTWLSDHCGVSATLVPVREEEVVVRPDFYAVTPDTGPVTGGTPVTIHGMGFTGGVGVTFDGVSAADVLVVDRTTITCISPPHPAGPVVVAVAREGVWAGKNDAFTYVEP
jgi:hypothetical protein